MNFYTFNDGITRDIEPSKLNDFEKDNGLKVISYHSTYPSLYKYEFSNGHKGKFTKKGAKIFSIIHGIKIESGGPIGYPTGDRYAGYNPALGMEISGKTEFKRICKERGLTEVGNDRAAFNAMETDKSFNYSESDIRAAVQSGAKISDSEGDALIDGSI